MVDFVELSNKRINSVRTIEELLVEFVPQTFKCYFQNFLLKANQQYVEILTTTYIFQSHSIYNISGKVVRKITKHYDRYISLLICKQVATTRRQPTLISLSIQIKIED